MDNDGKAGHRGRHRDAKCALRTATAVETDIPASRDFHSNADRGWHLKTCILAVKTTFLHVCSYSGLSTKRMTATGVADC